MVKDGKKIPQTSILIEYIENKITV